MECVAPLKKRLRRKQASIQQNLHCLHYLRQLRFVLQQSSAHRYLALRGWQPVGLGTFDKFRTLTDLAQWHLDLLL